MPAKSKFLMALLTAVIATNAHASKTILPDACGSDKIKFDVDAKKNQPSPAAPAEGKAQIVFIETVISPRSIVGHADFSTRFGMDGAWMGGASSNSYFVVDIAPGEHHLCGTAAGFFTYSDVIGKQNLVRLASFTAEPGKVYYYEFTVQITNGGRDLQGTTSFSKLEEDDGKYRIKSYKLATFTALPPD